jgi:hypothetical protein
VEPFTSDLGPGYKKGGQWNYPRMNLENLDYKVIILRLGTLYRGDGVKVERKGRARFASVTPKAKGQRPDLYLRLGLCVCVMCVL